MLFVHERYLDYAYYSDYCTIGLPPLPKSIVGFPWKNNVLYMEHHGIPWYSMAYMVLHGVYRVNFLWNAILALMFRGIPIGSS